MSWGKHQLPNNWTTLRKQILNRDNHTCQHCGDTGTEVDHIVNRANGGTNHPDNLQTLCPPCHQHKTRKETNIAKRKRTKLAQHPGEQHPGMM